MSEGVKETGDVKRGVNERKNECIKTVCSYGKDGEEVTGLET